MLGKCVNREHQQGKQQTNIPFRGLGIFGVGVQRQIDSPGTSDLISDVGVESVISSILALLASAVLSEAALLRVILAGGGDGRAPPPWPLDDESTMMVPAFAGNGAGLSRVGLSGWGKRDEKGLNTSVIFSGVLTCSGWFLFPLVGARACKRMVRP